MNDFPCQGVPVGYNLVIEWKFPLISKAIFNNFFKKVSAISCVVWVSQVKELCDVNIINVTKNTAHLN